MTDKGCLAKSVIVSKIPTTCGFTIVGSKRLVAMKFRLHRKKCSICNRITLDSSKDRMLPGMVLQTKRLTSTELSALAGNM